MRLTEAQQERYARHLLLDELGGEGQERLLSSCVRVRGTGRAARWAARYLAASGIGALVLDDPAAAAESRELCPEVRILSPGEAGRQPDLDLDLGVSPQAASRQPPAELGATAALRALRELGRP
jgi:hypothetical protein